MNAHLVKSTGEPRRPPPGPKIVIGAASGRREREADRRASHALAISTSELTGDVRCPVQSDARRPASEAVTSTIGHVVPGGGTPLEQGLRREMEQRFAEDFSEVRTHVGADAARSAANVGARAYTLGNHIVFGAGYSPSNRQLLAHELAHVLQQERGPPILLRKPVTVKLDPRVDRSQPDPKIPQWTPADQVLELRRMPGETWEITMSGVTSVEAARSVLWPKWFPKDIAPMSLKVAITDPIERGWFVISGLEARHLQYMQASIAPLFRDRGLVDDESPQLGNARQSFRSHNSGLADWEVGMIDRALKRVTRGNADLMLAYYEYYSSHDLESADMSALGDTKYGWTKISEALLLQEPKQATSDPLKLLGSTLIHEFAHTPQGGWVNDVEKVINEAKAYGVELFFAERMGDTKRVNDIMSERMWGGNDSLTRSTGAYDIFNRTYRIIAKLYEIIDGQGGAGAAAARRMSVEFISKNEADYGPELRSFISKNAL